MRGALPSFFKSDHDRGVTARCTDQVVTVDDSGLGIAPTGFHFTVEICRQMLPPQNRAISGVDAD